MATVVALLSAGERKMRFVTGGDAGFEHNVNYFSFNLRPPDGDLDADTDVDGDDFIGFEECMAGPSVAPEPTAPPTIKRCKTAFDFNGDTDVDAVDFAEFQSRFTGST